MPNFRFMHAQFPDPKLSMHEITQRLSWHRRKLLAAKMGIPPAQTDGGDVEVGLDDVQCWGPYNAIVLGKAVRDKIERRAALINKRHLATSGLTHLKSEDVEKLEGLRGGSTRNE